jgi:hypothetical protein
MHDNRPVIVATRQDQIEFIAAARAIRQFPELTFVIEG